MASREISGGTLQQNQGCNTDFGVRKRQEIAAESLEIFFCRLKGRLQVSFLSPAVVAKPLEEVVETGRDWSDRGFGLGRIRGGSFLWIGRVEI